FDLVAGTTEHQPATALDAGREHRRQVCLAYARLTADERQCDTRRLGVLPRRIQAAELLLSSGRVPVPRDHDRRRGPENLRTQVLAAEHPSVQALGLVRGDHSELSLE